MRSSSTQSSFRSEQVAVAGDAHARGEPLLGIARQRAEREEAAVAMADHRDALLVDPVELREEFAREQAVADVVETRRAPAGALERPPVPSAAAVVRSEPPVSLLDEVLREPVPLVARARRGTVVHRD